MISEEIKKIKKTMMLLEVSAGTIKKMIGKFKKEDPNLNEPEAIKLLDDFERIKQALNPNDRDITKYTFQRLKDTVENYETKKSVKNTEKDAFTLLKSKGVKVDNDTLKKAIRHFFEIKDALPSGNNDIKNYNEFTDLSRMLYAPENKYETLIAKILAKNFESYISEYGKEVILSYIQRYLEQYKDFPLSEKRVDLMTFQEFETYVDANSKVVQKDDVSMNLDEYLVLDTDNIKVYHAPEKPIAIALGCGRSWCTSRQGKATNLFYNYRLSENLTLYYLINSNLNYHDLNYALVILVTPQGQFKLADKSNSGRFSGTQIVSWDEIVEKCPQIKNHKKVFVPRPLTNEQQAIFNRLKNVNVGNNPMEYFDNDEKEVALWMEINTNQLTDVQYANLTADLQKLYIQLGFTVGNEKLSKTKPAALEYLITKKIDYLSSTPLSGYDHEDIVILNAPSSRMSALKKKLFEKALNDVLQELSSTKNESSISSSFDIKYPSSTLGKFVALYGIDSLVQHIPQKVKSDITNLTIDGKVPQNDSVGYRIKIPESIAEFSNVVVLVLAGGVNEITNKICTLKNLNFIAIVSNPELNKLPDCLALLVQRVVSDGGDLGTINLSGYPGKKPDWLTLFFKTGDIPGASFYSRKSEQAELDDIDHLMAIARQSKEKYANLYVEYFENLLAKSRKK